MDCISCNREMMLENSHTALLPGINATLAEPAILTTSEKTYANEGLTITMSPL